MSAATASSQPLRALALLGAALAGWAVARLPAALENQRALVATLAAPYAPATLPGPPLLQAAALDYGESWPVPISDGPAGPAGLPLPAAPAAPVPLRWQLARMPVQLAAPAPPAPHQLAAVEPLPSPLPAAAPAPAPEAARPPTPAAPGVLAEAGYERLRQGNRREAARLFEAALAADPEAQDPRATVWRRELGALKRRWRAETFVLLRNSPADPTAGLVAGPVLGASQTGASLSYTPAPLSRRPVSVVARLNGAITSSGSADPRTSQAAFGVRWQLTPGLAITGERLVAVGEFARNDWLLRVSGGTSRSLALAGRNTQLDAYGEASLIGNGDMVAAGQTRGLVPVWNRKSLSVSAGLGGWGAVQRVADLTTGRLDIGPSAVVRLNQGRLALELAADWRQRVAGDADPGSGPVVTLSTAF